MSEYRAEAKENPRLVALRNALAANRSIGVLDSVVKEAESTVEHDESKRVSYFEGLYHRLHSGLFEDWHLQNAQRPGEIRGADARDTLRNTILNELCANGNGAGSEPRGLFDSNGYVIYHEKEHVAEVLANFYDKMRNAHPFSYGNELTLDMFMMALGKLPAFQEVYPGGIDVVRRLDKDDLDALHKNGDRESLTRAFIHAMDPARTPPLKNRANGYGKWEKHVEYVSGIQFLSHEKDGHTFLVTVNGGLVPLENIKPRLEKFLKSDALLFDFPPIPNSELAGYLPGTEALRAPGKTDIDGTQVSAEAAPLMCMDINILTGLRPPSSKMLLEMLAQSQGKDAPLFTLANNPQLKGQLMEIAGDDPKRRRIVEVAYDNLSLVTSKLDEAKKKIFEGDPDAKEERARMPKTSVDNPRLYISMGGAGSGKSAVKEYAKAQCGNNFVEASLDEFRKISDKYKLLTAAGHHGDDYVVIEPFANTLRQWVADAARERKVNVLYDGTGVVYQPRYAKVAQDFKKAGFETNVVAVDTPLENAIKRVKSRFEDEKRALPWIVVTGKHTRTPRSFIQSVEDSNVDKVALFANDAGKDQHYLVAESFLMDGKALREMQGAQRDKRLKGHLEGLMQSRDDSALKMLSQGDGGTMDEMKKKNPHFAEENTSFLGYRAPGGNNRVLAVYNTERMIGLMEKGTMNPHASFVEGLRHTPANITMPFELNQRIRQILGSGFAPAPQSGMVV